MSSVRYSFAKYGCMVFADNARTLAYHKWACENDLYEGPQPEISDCSCGIDDPDAPHENPIDDSAPWYDPNDDASSEFLGFFITKVTGDLDSTITREVTDGFEIGSVLNRARTKGRQFAFEGLILSTTCRGADYGIEWLRRVFETRPCGCDVGPCQPCFGDELQLRRHCDDAPVEAGKCDTGLRTWHSVGVVDGVTQVEDAALDELCCTVRRVTLTLHSESPYSYGCEDVVCSTTVDPEGLEICYDWINGCHDCCDDAPNQCDRCVRDELCNCFPNVQPEAFVAEQEQEDCWCEPLSRFVQCCCVDTIGGQGFDSALRIDLFSGIDGTNDIAAEDFNRLGMRNTRITIYDNPDNLDCIDDQESYEDWCNSRPKPRYELKIPFVPSQSTLVIDGTTNQILLECDGVCRPYVGSITNTRGRLFPLVTNCESMMVCVEWDAENSQLRGGDPLKVRSGLTVSSYRRWLS